MKIRITIDIEIDFKYWTTGCLNVNLHNKSLEIEFLCFGIYFQKQ